MTMRDFCRRDGESDEHYEARLREHVEEVNKILSQATLEIRTLDLSSRGWGRGQAKREAARLAQEFQALIDDISDVTGKEPGDLAVDWGGEDVNLVGIIR
ncbi:MAG TPA: hypothetical protein VFV38_18030, partial [Ktedonobacteraceae bacterium]|nr:hypothetical protein [Ktedonobacteraceae bacterium]